MICLKCGKENIQQSKFCSRCGNSLITDKIIDDKSNMSFDELKDKIEENIKDELTINNNINQNISAINNNEQNNNSIDVDFYGNDFKKSDKKGLVIISLIFIILIILGIGLYFFYKPRNMLLLSTQKYISNLKINKDVNSMSSTYKISFDMKSNDEKLNSLFEIYNSLKISGLYEIDLNKKVSNFEFGSIYKDKTLLNGSVYSENNNYYFLLEGINDDYIKYSNYIENNNVNNDIDKKDIDNIYNGLINSVKNAIKDEYLTKSKEKITINDKKYNTNKVTLIINDNNFKIIIKDIFTYLKSDNNFVNSVNNISGNDTVSEFDKYLNSLDELNIENININIDFYIRQFTNDLLKLEIKNSISGIDIFKFDMVKNNINIFIKENDNIMNFKYTKKDGDNIIELSSKDFVIKINYNIVLKYNKDIINKDISKSVELKSLTENEITGLMNKIYASDGFVELTKDFTTYINHYNNYLGINNYDNNLNNRVTSGTNELKIESN